MRLVASVVSAAWALALLAGCAFPPPATDPEEGRKAGYNRREIIDPRPGVFTGEDGAWTVERSKRSSPTPADCESEQGCEVDEGCESGEGCEPAPEEAGGDGEDDREEPGR